jgi:hypothetical protein
MLLHLCCICAKRWQAPFIWLHQLAEADFEQNSRSDRITTRFLYIISLEHVSYIHLTARQQVKC